MSKFLTAEDEYTGILVPEGGDARTAASVEPAFQGLANQIEFFRQRRKVACYSVQADEISADEIFSLAEVSAAAGYELDANQVTVPGPGRYLVLLNLYVGHHETDDPAVARVDVMLGGDAVAVAVGYRYSASTLLVIPLTALALLEITNPETQVISLMSQTLSGDLSIGTTGIFTDLVSTFVLMRLDDAA
jgi:hypothetical protein